MSGAIPPLAQYAFTAWCSVKKKAQGQLYLYLTKYYSDTLTPYLDVISRFAQRAIVSKRQNSWIHSLGKARTYITIRLLKFCSASDPQIGSIWSSYCQETIGKQSEIRQHLGHEPAPCFWRHFEKTNQQAALLQIPGRRTGCLWVGRCLYSPSLSRITISVTPRVHAGWRTANLSTWSMCS
jgi:hypothetical protein